MLNRISKALKVSPDYLLNGSLQDNATSAISDHNLLIQFKKVKQLPGDKKKLVMEFLEAFLFKTNVQQQLVA